jgi:hypothetical protein
LTYEIQLVMKALTDAVSKPEIFRRKDTQQVADRAIQMMREATVLKPDLRVSIALARCLAARFEATHVINDYEEAIAIADKIFAAHPSGDSLTQTQKDTMWLIVALLTS